MTSHAENPLASDLDEVLETMGDLWQELRGARIFITGGTGFFGCWLLETLLWANGRLRLNASATVLTRDAIAFERKVPHLAADAALTVHAGDVRDFAFPTGDFTHVIHAATSSSQPVAPDVMFDTIVSGTRRTLEFARAAGARRFLLTSSGAVYGAQRPDLPNIAEDYVGAPDCTDPRNAYGEGKRAAEMLCAVHSSDTLQPVVARCFAFVGPRLPLNAHFAIGNFVRDAISGGPIRIKGDGRPYRSYLYASELASWLWTVLLRGTPLRPYNVGSPVSVSIADIAAAVRAVVDPALQIQVAGNLRTEPAPRYVPDVTRAITELGVRALVPFQESIARTVRWHRRQVRGVVA